MIFRRVTQQRISPIKEIAETPSFFELAVLCSNGKKAQLIELCKSNCLQLK